MCEATFQRCDDNALADSNLRDREDSRHRNAGAASIVQVTERLRSGGVTTLTMIVEARP